MAEVTTSMMDLAPAPGAEPKERRARRSSGEIRRLILTAARRQFASRGFAGATTRQIASDADVAEPLVFNNFGSKAALFTEAVIEPFNTRFAEFLSLSDRLPPDRERRSASFVNALYPFLRDNADLLQAMVKSGGDMDSPVRHGLDDYFARGAERMRRQYAEAGLRLDVSPELLVRYAFGMLAGSVLLRDWFFPDMAPDEQAAEATLARMLFKASEPLPDPSGSRL